MWVHVLYDIHSTRVVGTLREAVHPVLIDRRCQLGIGTYSSGPGPGLAAWKTVEDLLGLAPATGWSYYYSKSRNANLHRGRDRDFAECRLAGSGFPGLSPCDYNRELEPGRCKNENITVESWRGSRSRSHSQMQNLVPGLEAAQTTGQNLGFPARNADPARGMGVIRAPLEYSAYHQARILTLTVGRVMGTERSYQSANLKHFLVLKLASYYQGIELISDRSLAGDCGLRHITCRKLLAKDNNWLLCWLFEGTAPKVTLPIWQLDRRPIMSILV